MVDEVSESRLRVLFLGRSDARRSLIAAQLLRSYEIAGVEVLSAGVEAGADDVRTARVLEEIGLMPLEHTPHAISELAHGTFDLVVSVCDHARAYRHEMLGQRSEGQVTECPDGKGPLFVGSPVHLDWFVEDLAEAAGGEEEVLAVYRKVRDDLQQHVRGLVQHGYLSAFASQRATFEQLFDTLDEGIVAHDDEGHIFLFNRAAERITGTPREQVLGRQCHTAFAPNGLCGVACPRYRGLPPSAGVKPDYKIHFTTPGGEYRRLKISVNRVVDGPGHINGVMLTLRDITEVSELRWQLKGRHSFRGLVGISQVMQDVVELIHQVTVSDYPVLITGESGTGKELVAKAIHAESRRSEGPFVAINCGAVPEQILESELFGHVRGAFTGAIRDKKGRFALADHGTLFLDEVGELTPAFQVKLLRVLQEQRFEQVGSERVTQVDVRIISATNRELRSLVQQGRFREDLFYRLCVVPIELPPLHRRREDLTLLVEKFLEDIRRETSKEIWRVSDEAMDLMLAYRWPGNVRELRNALQVASVRCIGSELLPGHLPLEVRQSGAARVPEPQPDTLDRSDSGERRAGRRPKLQISAVEEALRVTGGNKAMAARLLGVGRATLYRYIRTQSPADR